MTLFDKYEAAKAAAESAADAAKKAAARLAAERAALTAIDAEIEAITEKRTVEIDRRAAIAADDGKVPGTALPSAREVEDQRCVQVTLIHSLEGKVSELQAEQRATAGESAKIWQSVLSGYAAPLRPGRMPRHPMSLADVKVGDLLFAWSALKRSGYGSDFNEYLKKLLFHRPDLTREQDAELIAEVFDYAKMVNVAEPEPA